MKKKTIAWAAVMVLVAGGLFVGLRGCALMPWNEASSSGTVTVSITRDYGRSLIKTGDVRPRSGDTVMDVLKMVAKVDTEYGGGFVAAIDGISSGSNGQEQSDWFYYLNGILADTGSAQVEAHGGDTVWWDYRTWSTNAFVPAVVGCYPKPFTRGYPGAKQASTVVYGDALENTARAVGVFLSAGGADVGYARLEPEFANVRGGPVMAFLSPEQATATQWSSALLSGPDKGGAFVALVADRIVPLDGEGKQLPGPDLIAAIVSTGAGMGDAAPVWLVICDGEAGAGAVEKLLADDPGPLQLAAGLAVRADGTTLELPAVAR